MWKSVFLLRFMARHIAIAILMHFSASTNQDFTIWQNRNFTMQLRRSAKMQQEMKKDYGNA